MKKQGYVWGVIFLCQIRGGSRKLGNKKQKKKSDSIKDEVILTMQTKGKALQFEGEDTKLKRKY